MYKDIFQLARATSSQPNPIITALLYSVCPAAAHWYVRKIQPEDPFDVVWQALEDYSTGKTMAECLEEYGLATLLPDIKQYIDRVTLFRSRYSALGTAPELTPLFTGNTLGPSAFGLQSALNRLGGSRKSLLLYVRVWAFLIRDWKAQMRIPPGDQVTRVFKKFIVALSIPGDYSRSKLHFPVWGWDVTVGKVRNTYLGLLVSGQKQDALRFSLVANSDLVGEKAWPGQRPSVYGLDREIGSASLMNLSIEHSDLSRMAVRMYETACLAPNFPLGAFRDSETCQLCGYKTKCYRNDGTDFLPAAVDMLLYEAARESRLGKPGKQGNDQLTLEANDE